MAVKHFQIGRGTYDKAIVYTGLVGELILDTTNMQVRVHDGETMGGYPIAKDVLATSSARGLMAPEDKAKLDTLQNYVLPTAGLNKLGGVKTTSTVTSASGYTACPIISGVPYYANIPAVSLYIGAVDAKADAATSNGATYLKLFSDNTLSKQFNIKGSGATTVTSDASGSLIINSVNTTYTAATNAPLAPGTAAVGTSAKYAREDHVHPVQTTISGNAGTATKLANGAKIGISGAVTGTATLFDGSADITIPTTGIDVSKANAGTLPVARGGTGQTSVANIQAGKDAAGNVITETYATKTEVNNLRSGLVQTVPALPETGTEGIIYLVPNTTDPNTYDQFTWENGAYVPLGNTSFNLGDYVKKENVVTALTISGRTITYTKGDGTTGTLTTQDNNTTYSAGTGLSLSGTTFSVSSTAGTSALSWGTEVTLGTVGGLAIKAKLPANPNSDTKVTQNISTTSSTYPVLLTPTANANANVGASTAIFGAGIKANPSTGELIATKFTGALAGNANTATKATQDSAGQQINTTYIKGLSVSGKTITYTKGDGTTGTITTQDTNTTYSVATTSANGLMSADDKAKLDGLSNYVLPTAANGILGGVKTSSTVTSASGYTACPIIDGIPYYKDTNTTYTLSSLGIGNVKNYDQSKAISSITRSGTTFTYTCLDGTTGTFTQQDNNTTYSNMTAATADAAGKAGLVPAPAAGKQTAYLRGDGTWQVPPNTTYSNFVKSGSGAKAGLVPAPSTTAGTTKYLREDGTWSVPPDTNTTYTFTAGTSTLAWNSEVTLATVGGLDIKAKLPANPNSDTKVTQNLSTANNTYPVLLTPTANATANAGATTAIFGSGIKANPSTGELIATKFTGALSGTATKATQDSAGQQINTTYIKGLSVSGRTITYTKGDGTTGTITTQDNNTWTAFKGATSSAAGTAGYVPAPAKGDQAKFFRADGTWAVPTNTTYSAGTGLTLSGTTFSVTANTYAAASHTHSYLPLSGGTVTGTLTLSRTTDASGTANNKPALIIGGTDTTAHIEIDANEILAKASDTTISTLNLNTDGGLVAIGNGGLSVGTGGVTTTGTFAKKNTAVTKGTNPSSTTYWTLTFCDKDGISYGANCLGMFETSMSTAGVVSTYIRAVKNEAASSANCTISCIYDTANNLAYTSAPTPADNDNSTKIATTAWVQKYCNTTKKYLTSHQSLANYSTLANTIKDLSISGRTITYTKGDGTTGTLTTQDNNTTYSNFVKSGSGAKAGLVPAPSTTAGTTKYLREDGTWQVPPNTTYSFTAGTSTLAWNSEVTLATVGGLAIKAKLPANPNSDTKVTQNISTTNSTYPVLLTPTANATANVGANTAIFGSGIKANPSTGELIATKFTGALSGTATKATQDSAGQQINTTYIKALSVSGKTITYTKGDGTTGTITTQDTNTTYSNFVKSGSGAAAGLVPAPSTTAGTTKYLREDGTWQVPPDTNTTYSNFVKSGSGAKAGLVPAPSTTAGTTKYLREDGTWQVPPNTTYSFTAGTSTLAWNSEVTLATVGGLAIKAKLPANPNTNTDTLVTQNVSTTNAAYPLLLCPTADATANQGAKTAIFASGVKVNPSNGGLIVGTGGVTTTGTVLTTNTFAKQNTAITKGTNPTATTYWAVTFCDKNGINYSNNCLGMFETSIDTNGVVKSYIRAMKNAAANSENCQITCIYDTANSKAYTEAPHPAVGDSTTKIATTAWVMNTANRKQCLVGQSGSTNTNPWYKFASFAATVANDDPQITFFVEQTYGSRHSGILRCHVRLNGSIIYESCNFDFLTNTGLDPAKFMLVAGTAAKPTIELWVKIDTAYLFYRFVVISEGKRTSNGNAWNLYNASSAGQAANPTSGTQVTATVRSVSNKAAALAWNTTSTIATVDGINITVKLPANPNTTYSAGTGLTLSGTTFSVAANTYAAASHTHSYLPLSGGTLTGQLIMNRHNGSFGGGIRLIGGAQNHAISISSTEITKGTAPTALHYTGIDFYGSAINSYKDRIGMIEHTLGTDNVSSMYLRAYSCTSTENTATSSIGVHVDGSGNAYTSALTPADNDNTTKIATTAWVQRFCGTTKKYLTAHQSLSNYSTLANTIKSLSINGKTITYTKGDNTTGTLTTQDNNTTYSAGTGLSLSGTTFSVPASLSLGNIEFNRNGASANNGGWLDFHYNQSTADNTSRIIESASGVLNINGATFTKSGTVVAATTFKGYLDGQAAQARILRPVAIAEDSYTDVMVAYRGEATSKRCAVFRVNNGSGYNEITMGVSNENDSAPSGITIRNTNGTWSISRAGHPAFGDHSTAIATTAWVHDNALYTKRSGMDSWSFITSNSSMTNGSMSSATSMAFAMVASNSDLTTNLVNGKKIGGVGMYAKDGQKMSGLKVAFYTSTTAASEVGFDMFTAGSPGSQKTSVLFRHGGHGEVFGPSPSWSAAFSANADTGTVLLGSTTYLWKQVCAKTSSIATSDERLKTQIAPIPDEILDAWGDLQYSQFKWIDTVEKEGEAARLHVGAVAQAVERMFQSKGIDVTKYSFFCHTPEEPYEWTEEVEVEPGVKEERVVKGVHPDRYALRYADMLVIEAVYQRRRADRLEARLSRIEKALNLD